MTSKWLRVVAVLALALGAFATVTGFADDDNEAKLKGVIQKLPNTPGFVGDWIVSGKTVHVTSSTRIDQEHGAVRVGATVKVEGTQRTDGSIDAKEIEVLEADQENEVEFTGVIQSLPNTPGFIGDWVVSGRIVHVTSSTRIDQEDGTVKVGVTVKVEGTQRTDGSVDAKEIEVLAAEKVKVEFTGTIQSLPNTPGFIGDWMVSGRIVHVTSATKIVSEAGPVILGAMVVVSGTQRTDGSIDASHIVVKPNIVEFQGVIESLPATTGFIGDWRVGGKIVHVSSSTRIEGTPLLGLRAEVHGSMRADGSIDASKIEILGAGQEENQNVVFRGTIQSLPAGGNLIGIWTVSGRVVHVTADTRLQSNDGAFVVGATVKVKGTQMSDGSVLATRIQLKH